MKKTFLSTSILLALSFITFSTQNRVSSEVKEYDFENTKKTKDMKSFISLFEIPASDMSRAINFYQEVLGIKIERMDLPGMEMGIFPYQDQIVQGVIMKDGESKASPNGVTIYLDGGDDLQIMLDKVELNGGQIIVGKTAHADESGFFALFLDSEGNKMGLNSPN